MMEPIADDEELLSMSAVEEPSSPLLPRDSALQLPVPPVTPPRLADVTPPPSTPAAEGRDRLFSPTACRLCCSGSAPVSGVVNVDYKRVKFACTPTQQPEGASIDATLRVPLESLLECRLVGPAPDMPATEVTVQIAYHGGRLAASAELCLDAEQAVMLHAVLVPFVPASSRAVRAALRERWGAAIGRTFCFSHGDAIPSLIASRGQQFHESEGELRVLPVEVVGRYGRDLQLRMQAKTIGIWRTIQTYSLNAAEFCLVPSAVSITGEALCLQRQVDGTSGAVGVEDTLTVEGATSAGGYGGITQRRRYCSGPYCIAETTRTYRFTERYDAAAASAPTDQIESEHGGETWERWEQDESRRVERKMTEARVLGSHQDHDGHVRYSCQVGWSELGATADGLEQSTVRRYSVAKRYSEWVALEKQLRTKQAAAGVTLSEKDTFLPRLQNRSTAGRGGSKSAAVIAERVAEVEEWLQMALLHPLASDSLQLKEFLSSDEIEARTDGVEGPYAAISTAAPHGHGSSRPPSSGSSLPMSPPSVNHGQGQTFRRVSGRRAGERGWEFIPVQVHVLEGKVFHVLRANYAGEGEVPRHLQIVKRYSECVKLDNAFAFARRDPSVAQRLPKLDTKISADDTEARLQAVQRWLRNVGSVPSIWESTECQQFLNVGSLLMAGPAAGLVDVDAAEHSDGAVLSTFFLRLCGVSENTDNGHHLYTFVVIPSASCVTYNVTRVPNLTSGQLVQFLQQDQTGGEDMRCFVAVPAGIAENETFPAAVDQSELQLRGENKCGATVLIEKRYSEWVALDEQVRRHPQLAASTAMPPRLRDESTLFQSKKETVLKRSAELQAYATALAATPFVWQAAAVRDFFAVDLKGDKVAHCADGFGASVVAAGAESAGDGKAQRLIAIDSTDAVATMRQYLDDPMDQRPMWAPRSGPLDGWAALLHTPSVVLKPPSGLARQTLAAVAPAWLAKPDTLRRIEISLENSDGAALIDEESSKGPPRKLGATPDLWLRIDCRPADLSRDWAEAIRLSFASGAFSLRPCGGGRAEVLVLRGVHTNAADSGECADGDSAGDGAMDDVDLFFSTDIAAPVGGAPMQKETHFVLEVSEHPDGLHEQLTWGLPGEAGSCVTSWVRSQQSDLAASAGAEFSRIARRSRFQHLGPSHLQMTTADVTRTLLGEGWRVLWERERSFVQGDDIPDVIGRTNGMKTFALASAVGMSVPIPGFVLVGAIAGGVASTPSNQLKAARYIANELTSRMRLKQHSSFGDTLLTVEIGHHGRWRTQEVFSFNHGDFWLKSLSDSEQQRAEATTWTEQALCLRSRLKRSDAVYIVIDELTLHGDLQGLTEQRRVLCGDICIATSARVYCLRDPAINAEDTVAVNKQLSFCATDTPANSDTGSSHVSVPDGLASELSSVPAVSASEIVAPAYTARFGGVPASGETCGTGLTHIQQMDLPAPVQPVRCGWLEMKVKIGWTRRYFEMTVQELPELPGEGPPQKVPSPTLNSSAYLPTHISQSFDKETSALVAHLAVIRN